MALNRHVNQLSVQHFGPITTGMGRKMLTFTPVTVFIGPSGSGKSSVAKLYATLVWMEKAVSVGSITEEEAADYNFFVEKLKYHKISHYLKPNSNIHYKGYIMDWKLKDGKIFFQYEHYKINEYAKILPKVQYTPADRSFLTAIDKPENLKLFLDSTYDYLVDYKNAQLNLAGIELDTLINSSKYVYDKGGDTGYIKDEDYIIKIQEASSGIQSVVPLILLSEDLKKQTSGSDTDESTSLFQLNQAKNRIISLINNNISVEIIMKNGLQVKFRNASDLALQTNMFDSYTKESIINYFKAKTITHIIEEPELNLYPETQGELMYKLIADMKDVGQLVLTTHSPYLINALALSVKAKDVAEKHPEYIHDIAEIVPMEAMISSDDLSIYETLQDGTIRKLAYEYGIPSDANLLNQNLEAGNTQFTRLQEIEMGWHK